MNFFRRKHYFGGHRSEYWRLCIVYILPWGLLLRLISQLSRSSAFFFNITWCGFFCACVLEPCKLNGEDNWTQIFLTSGKITLCLFYGQASVKVVIQCPNATSTKCDDKLAASGQGRLIFLIFSGWRLIFNYSNIQQLQTFG